MQMTPEPGVTFPFQNVVTHPTTTVIDVLGDLVLATDTEFEINGIEHMENEYGVFSKKNDEERRKFEELRQHLQAFAQNGMSKGILAEILDETNFDRVKELAHKADQIEQEYAQSMEKIKGEVSVGGYGHGD